jgi:D-sedoheptulose 7-phosphate isomerase
MEFIKNSLLQAQETLTTFMSSQSNLDDIQKAVELLTNAYQSKRRVFSCGNGGSMCDAMHFAEELTGRYRKDRAALAATAIADPSHMSCVANDFGYDKVFSRYIEGWGESGDILLAISTSGNSPNVLNAVSEAKKRGMHIIGLSGKTGGELKKLAEPCLIVESSITDRIQEIHIKIIHILIEGIERNLFPENY